MSCTYSDPLFVCKYCGQPVRKYKYHDGCIIDMIYKSYENGNEPTRAMIGLAYKRGINPVEIRKDYYEDVKIGRISGDEAGQY